MYDTGAVERPLLQQTALATLTSPFDFPALFHLPRTHHRPQITCTTQWYSGMLRQYCFDGLWTGPDLAVGGKKMLGAWEVRT